MRILRFSVCGAALLSVLALTTAAQAASPTFTNYAGPAALVGDAGEPSIGYNPATDATLFQSYTTTAKVSGFDGAGHANWQDVTEPTAVTSLDPILWTDRDTGRSISSQLLLACSKAMITDNDGASWTPSTGCGIGTGIDHQTIGGGPWSSGGLGPSPLYPHAVYYCTQDGFVAAHCATSYDGGQTFGPERETYTVDQCPLLLHGHIKVAPDGTAYLPTADCDGKQSFAVSKDNGLSWSVEEVPGTTTQDESDPHLGIGDKGTLYYGWQGGDGQDLGDKGDFANARTEGPPGPPATGGTSPTPAARVVPGSRSSPPGRARGARRSMSARSSASRTSSSPRCSPATTTAPPSRSSGPRPPATTRRRSSRASGICTWPTPTTAVCTGRRSTRPRLTRCSAAASGCRAGRARSATCSTSTTSRWTARGASSSRTPTAAPTRASPRRSTTTPMPSAPTSV